MKKFGWLGLLLILGSIWLFRGNSAPWEPETAEPEQEGQAVAMTNFYCRRLVSCTQGTALVLENTANISYRRVQVVVIQNGKRLYFDAEAVPAYGWVVIFERNATPFAGESFEDCYCLTALPE